MCVSVQRGMDEETEPYSKQRNGPKMAMEGSPERTSSHEHTLNVQLHMEELPLKKKSLKTGWVTPTQLGNERRCTSDEAAVTAAGKCLECFTSKGDRNFPDYDNTVDQERELCGSNTDTVLPRYNNLSKFNIIQLLEAGNEPVCPF